MKLYSFRQIRGAFHPEDKAASVGGDKSNQLRHAINILNRCSQKNFIPSGNMTFDEGRGG